MGCDIHLHIEAKVEGRWEHYGAPYISSNYMLFEKMAGVRGEVCNAISSPKGLPDDLSIVTRMSAHAGAEYDHSWSWLNRDEIALLEEWLKELSIREGLSPGCLQYDLEHTILHCYCEGNSFAYGVCPWIEDIRFVFWFDN